MGCWKPHPLRVRRGDLTMANTANGWGCSVGWVDLGLVTVSCFFNAILIGKNCRVLEISCWLLGMLVHIRKSEARLIWDGHVNIVSVATRTSEFCDCLFYFWLIDKPWQPIRELYSGIILRGRKYYEILRSWARSEGDWDIRDSFSEMSWCHVK